MVPNLDGVSGRRVIAYQVRRRVHQSLAFLSKRDECRGMSDVTDAGSAVMLDDARGYVDPLLEIGRVIEDVARASNVALGSDVPVVMRQRDLRRNLRDDILAIPEPEDLLRFLQQRSEKPIVANARRADGVKGANWALESRDGNGGQSRSQAVSGEIDGCVRM